MAQRKSTKRTAATKSKKASYGQFSEQLTTRTPEQMREDTRSKIALRFIYGYLGVIATLIVLSFFSFPTDRTKDFLLAIGSPLGFIIGFYFKSEK